MTTIPGSLFVAVTPSVLGVGGNAVDVIGLALSESNRVPIGSVYSFSSAAAVTAFFGSASAESIFAGGASGKGSGYFGGFTGCKKLPGSLLFAQYNATAAAAYVWGGNVGAALTLAQLQAVSGTLAVVMDGVSRSAGSIDLSAAASFSAAATALETDLNSGIATIASITAAIAGTTLTVSAVGSGVIAAGQAVIGTGVDSGLYILSQLTGTAGGIGTYQLSGTDTVSSEAMTTQGVPLSVDYDSLSGAFVITSGITGAISTSAFPSGSAADDLLLISSTGAYLSQGAAAATPADIMDGVINVTDNFVTYTTTFDPDGGSGNDLKAEFAAWKNSYPNRFAYVCWDTDVLARSQPPQTETLGYILDNNDDSGTCLISELTDLNLAAFICGAAASIDFTQKNGRTTFAYRKQAGLVADVITQTAAVNAGGNPQVLDSFGNGYNYFGAVGQGNSDFSWFQRGVVTGPFRWFDSYINQVWWNSLLQSALLSLMDTALSIPFNQSGAGQITLALAEPIQAGLNFGVAAPGAISSSQIAQVNSDAGADIAGTLQTQGYYLQVKQQSSLVRANRGPWAITLWYLDRGSVQSFSLSSVALQ